MTQYRSIYGRRSPFNPNLFKTMEKRLPSAQVEGQVVRLLCSPDSREAFQSDSPKSNAAKSDALKSNIAQPEAGTHVEGTAERYGGGIADQNQFHRNQGQESSDQALKRFEEDTRSIDKFRDLARVDRDKAVDAAVHDAGVAADAINIPEIANIVRALCYGLEGQKS